MDTQKIETAITMLLEAVGEDPNREGLKETPARVARMYQELLGGMQKDGSEHLSKVFSAPDSEIVVEKNILLSLRAPHAALLWQRSHCLHSQWQGGGPQQNGPARGGLRPPASDPGTYDRTDRR